MYESWRNTNADVARLDVEIVAASVVFALIVLGLRAATPVAAAFGGMICLILLWGTASPHDGVMRSGLAPLILLFVLTFVSTRAGHRIKAMTGLAERRKGRTAAQVIANLAVAALSVANLGTLIVMRGNVKISGDYFHSWAYPAMMMMCLAALVEATADTVSSEIGQAFGGTPRMLVGLQRVEAGTDGAVTVLGFAAGVAAGVLVAAIGIWALRLSVVDGAIALFAGVCGLFFDSLLGATAERRGWVGNDLVNFSSTVFAAAVALTTLWVLERSGM
jgi:uncharacterized protein (TIGR00297 family)